MKQAIKNLEDALLAHMEAQRVWGLAKDKLQKTRYAVRLASEELRAIKEEILEDNIRDL